MDEQSELKEMEAATLDAANGSETDPRPPTSDPPAGAAYRVRLDLFEGPLDLLLHLIKKNEVVVTDIPVATITEQYLAYLDLLRELSLDIAGEYLVMAATLTLLKSRLLLPGPEPDDDEDADPRADLVRQLLEYQRYREAAAALIERPLLRRDVFTRAASADGVPSDPQAAPPLRVTLWELMEAFRVVLQRARPDPVHRVEAEAVSLRDRIAALLRTLGVARSVTFDSLFGESPTRGFVIVTFLAVLELAKLGAIQAVQEDPLGPILLVLAVENVEDVTIDLLDEYDGVGLAPAAEPTESSDPLKGSDA
jgi:segregation and condensation protein A